MAGGWFGRKPAADRAISAQIREWAAAALEATALDPPASGDDPDIRFSVNEIVCRDPSCPGVETVILVMAPGRKTYAVKIARPMAEVCAQDVRRAVTEAAQRGD